MNAIILYNTLSRKKEVFRPLKKRKVSLYTCGPTVYDFAHIGNLRTYIFEDVLRRTLMCAGFKITHIMNITDIDDKTIQASLNARISLRMYTRKYERIFKNDLRLLNILFPTRFTRATEHIADMISTIVMLIKERFAYKNNGSVYFRISAFKNYGRLSHLNKADLKLKAKKQKNTIERDEYSKNEARDFVLWKAAKPEEPFWQSPFGPGRPGWHIECSVMAMKYLGQPIDLHAAAIDLIFPHHENEIAQAEAQTKKPFVRYWLHAAHLFVNKEKMSKSLGNIISLRDLETKHMHPLSFRYLALTSHYRSQLNFTWASLASADQARKRIVDFITILKENKQKNHNQIFTDIQIVRIRTAFWKAIHDDLNTPRAIAEIWRLINKVNIDPEKYNYRKVLLFLYECDEVLGLNLKILRAEKPSLLIADLVQFREDVRKVKDFRKADEIRKTLLKKGWIVEDTSTGPHLKKA